MQERIFSENIYSVLPRGPQSLKYVLFGSFQKEFAGPRTGKVGHLCLFSPQLGLHRLLTGLHRWLAGPRGWSWPWLQLHPLTCSYPFSKDYGLASWLASANPRPESRCLDCDLGCFMEVISRVVLGGQTLRHRVVRAVSCHCANPILLRDEVEVGRSWEFPW